MPEVTIVTTTFNIWRNWLGFFPPPQKFYIKQWVRIINISFLMRIFLRTTETTSLNVRFSCNSFHRNEKATRNHESVRQRAKEKRRVARDRSRSKIPVIVVGGGDASAPNCHADGIRRDWLRAAAGDDGTSNGGALPRALAAQRSESNLIGRRAVCKQRAYRR